MIGTVHKAQPLCLHRRTGEARNETTSVEVLQVEPTGEPMIVHPDGRTFVLSWSDILRLAQQAFEAE
ncbi:TPA: hypothetical protein P9G65_005514 [Pseudomonas aeruginosa]|nr:hypothetical protein [Pseudomonas aeruginosa]HDQ4723226.1 hypothetical protein [Pseudomonas aeruginosa]